MKLKYVGPRPYITLHEVENAGGGKGIRAEKDQIFECSPLLASKLLVMNKQHVRPIFAEATEEAEDLLKDVEVKNNKMLGKSTKTK